MSIETSSVRFEVEPKTKQKKKERGVQGKDASMIRTHTSVSHHTIGPSTLPVGRRIALGYNGGLGATAVASGTE